MRVEVYIYTTAMFKLLQNKIKLIYLVSSKFSRNLNTFSTMYSFRLLPLDDWFKEKEYDFISALNLLDRCDKPLELLNYIKSSLKPDGRFLLALVLPFAPFVEAGLLITP